MIFNQFTLEYLLFPESAVMCLAVFCVLLAAIETTKNAKYKYIKIFSYLFIVAVSYQSLVMAFPVITVFLQFICMKRRKEKNLKGTLKDLIKYVAITIIVVAIEYIIIILSNKLLYEEMTRTVKLINFEAFWIRFRYAFNNLIILAIGFMNMLPVGFYMVVIGTTLITMIINQKTRKYLWQNILTIILTSISCMIFFFIFDSGQAARTNWIFGCLWGIQLLYLLTEFNYNKKMGKFIVGFVICSFIFNSFMILQNSAWHTASNAADKNDGYTFKIIIDKYENETGKKITKFAYKYDNDVSQYAVGIKKMGSLTERALACPWSIKQSLNYYTGRKLKEVQFLYYIYFEKIGAVNFEGFCEDEIYIEDDTIYIVVY